MASFSLPLVIAGALGSLGLGALCLHHHMPCCGNHRPAPETRAVEPGADTALVAHCVEARSASVFAGACHYNGELMTQGNEAVFAITVESGSSQGVDLGGVSAAALIASDKNLKLDGARRSIVYVSEGASEAQQVALVALLKQRSKDGLGEIIAIESAALSMQAAGDSFLVAIPDRMELRGEAMPDRACCTQPNLVWYEPLLPLENRLVGHTEVWRVQEDRLGLDFQRADENSAFIGNLAAARSCCAAKISE